MGANVPDPAWVALTSAPAMTLVIGLENALRPIAPRPFSDALDRGAVRVLEALIQTGAAVVVVSSQPKNVVDVLRRQIIAGWWIAESGGWRYDEVWAPTNGTSVDTWIRKRLPSRPLLAIGDGLPLECFQPVAPFEVAFSAGPGDPRVTRRRLSGTTAVRAFLWWLVDARSVNPDGPQAPQVA